MATKKQNTKALAKAVRERRDELGMTQQSAAKLSERIDVEVFHTKKRSPGVSRSTWADIEQAGQTQRREHTQELLDAVLRWPQGTAHAILYGQDLPEGPPLELPRWQNGVGGTASHDDAASRVETARALRDVADLRVEVAELAAQVSRLTRIIEGRDQ